MNLHHDQEAFREFVIAASNELQIPPGIIEKDYYVTLALRALASRVKAVGIKAGVIETYIALLPFPTVNRMADNYIYRFLKKTEQEDLAEEFDLMPFEIKTQAIERTLIDKVFAVCDYYLSDKVEGHSRHLYDIYKIMEYTVPDAFLSGLVQEVRSLREPLPVCPSAKTGVCINDLLAEIIHKEIYRQDHERITGKLLFTYLPYETVIGGVEEIISKGYFSST